MNPFQKKAIPAALMALMLTACGGGGGGGSSTAAAPAPAPAPAPVPPPTGGDSGGDASGDGGSESDGDGTAGISGSGKAVAYGIISGFGSIFVNGIEFDTDSADVFVDGQLATEDDLGVGMVVLVQGEVNDDGTTGTATVVVFDDEVEGPISAITPNADGDAKLITVLGVEIIVERTGTVFEDVTFDTLAVGDVVEVSGFAEVSGTLRATRIERKGQFQPGATIVELTGPVSGLTATEFSIGSLVVDYSQAIFDDDDDPSELIDGVLVEVKGTLTDDRITATELDLEDDLFSDFEDDDDFTVQGVISNFSGIEAFTVNGVAVDASSAVLRPADLQLADGVAVEVKGLLSGGVLRATEVESRRGRIEIEAGVAAVDSEAGTITLGLFAGPVTVSIDARTLFDDDTDQVDKLTLADIAIGDFLEVEAFLDGDTLVATRVDRDEADEEVIQAPVESFVAGAEITVLGVTFQTQGAEFESAEGADIPADVFFQQLSVGDLVKIEDDITPDGIADEVEFELEDKLDGGIEFDDDDDVDDDDDLDDDADDDSADDDADEDDDDADDDSVDDADDADEDDADDDSAEDESAEDESAEDESAGDDADDDAAEDDADDDAAEDDADDDAGDPAEDASDT